MAMGVRSAWQSHILQKFCLPVRHAGWGLPFSTIPRNGSGDNWSAAGSSPSSMPCRPGSPVCSTEPGSLRFPGMTPGESRRGRGTGIRPSDTCPGGKERSGPQRFLNFLTTGQEPGNEPFECSGIFSGESSGMRQETNVRKEIWTSHSGPPACHGSGGRMVR